MAGILEVILAFRKSLIIVTVVVLTLALPLAVPTKEAKCGYVIIVMAVFWCTEALPLAVTALLPVLLFPLMNIMDANTVCREYLKNTNMLFVGGLLVAIAIEHWHLHKRMALRVLLLTGVRPALLLMGFMVVTAFLSMWISNTATTAMMVPIARAALDQLHKLELESNLESSGAGQASEVQEGSTPEEKGRTHVLTIEDERKRNEDLLEEKHLKLCKGMCLCICYCSSIGGIATLTGTGPNLVLQGQVEELYPDNGGVITFVSWFSFAFPTMIVLLVLAWIWLQIRYLGFNFKENFSCTGNSSAMVKEKEAYAIIQEENKKLGRMKFAEIAVLVLFILLVLLCFTRDPGFAPGWATNIFNKKKKYVTDGTVAIFIAILLFIIPSGFYNAQTDGKSKFQAPPPLLEWKVVHEKMPWSIVFLLGGGFALAKGSEKSGLSAWLGTRLTPLQNIPHPAIAFLVCLLVATFTECTGNVATTTLFLPIVASMAEAICLNPLYVMLPCTLSASLAFMLPVATPPNAIVFSYGQLKVIDMAKAGFVLNILGVLTITLAINTWASSLLQLRTFPSWANKTGMCP
ncbi:LOW QUALITY PROTEIN: solute carrier family 13 member 2 [Myiozetetes cayanensis]|uniref:LOW QUALITY PROTEIN: solute carrier family 13 member 2 n=1 Tax=Myiozetetes cayanensis TaxID=478635 RepID=UPI00216059D5|nr:LOW QUALITY PROTEIN: solute carrier family 13 member 2 [Myiozetetes cayanensis]